MKHEESNIQIACVKWFRLVYKEPDYLICTFPNGGSRNIITASILKAEGSRAGMPDLVIFTHRKCFFIEMKAKAGRQSENQKQVETIDQWVKHVEEVEAQERLMNMTQAAAPLGTVEELPPTPELPPTQQVEFEEPLAAPEKETIKPRVAARRLERKRTLAGSSADWPVEISSDDDDGTPQDMDVDINLVSDEEDAVVVPDFIAYMMKPKFRHISAEEMLAFVSSASRFLKDRIELNKARRGMPTKNSSRIGKTYKKNK